MSEAWTHKQRAIDNEKRGKERRGQKRDQMSPIVN